MNSISQELQTIKEKIESNKLQSATLKGREEEMIKQLKTSYDLSSLDEAEQWLLKTDKELDKMEKSLESSFSSLKKEILQKIKTSLSLASTEEAEKWLLGTK